MNSLSLPAMLSPAKFGFCSSTWEFEIQELQTGQVRGRILLPQAPGYLLHLYVLRGLLGEVLLGAVVQDALHSEAPHSVDGRGDGPGVLSSRMRL